MRKTTREYVYDTLNFMRKPLQGVELTPIVDNDNPIKDYGFVKEDICKLINLISVDCGKQIMHTEIHKKDTVGEIIDAIDKELNRDENSLHDALFMCSVMENIMEGLDSMMEKVIFSLVNIRALYNLLGKENVDEKLKIVESYVKGLSKELDESKESLFSDTDKIFSIRKIDYEKEMKNLDNFYTLFIKECGGMTDEG